MLCLDLRGRASGVGAMSGGVAFGGVEIVLVGAEFFGLAVGQGDGRFERPGRDGAGRRRAGGLVFFSRGSAAHGGFSSIDGKRN